MSAAPLCVNVQMRLIRVAGISHLAEFFTHFDLLSACHGNSSFFEMREQDDSFAAVKQNVISWQKLTVGLRRLHILTIVSGLDNSSGTRRINRSSENRVFCWIGGQKSVRA